ncbi:SCF ubiquitin ligase complex subunit [Polyrhizophydium stewartii]|uniref:SCF ubiquitin ligase complex subunit n=1 Tax=Polyrhizophydium stewartii TaxID=2732419 RepID=A0ABR4NF66_9FUNG
MLFPATALAVGRLSLPLDICIHIFSFIDEPIDRLNALLVSEAFLTAGVQAVWARLDSASPQTWVKIHRVLTSRDALVGYAKYVRVLDFSRLPEFQPIGAHIACEIVRATLSAGLVTLDISFREFAEPVLQAVAAGASSVPSSRTTSSRGSSHTSSRSSSMPSSAASSAPASPFATPPANKRLHTQPPQAAATAPLAAILRPPSAATAAAARPPSAITVSIIPPRPASPTPIDPQARAGSPSSPRRTLSNTGPPAVGLPSLHQPHQSLQQQHHPPPTVRCLVLVGCQAITSQSLATAVRALPRLEILQVDGAPAMSDLVLVNIVSDALRAVSMLECADVTDAGINALAAHARRLIDVQWSLPESISLSNLITDRSLTALARAAPELRWITFTGLSRLSDATILELARSCPLLESIDVSYCPQITLSAVKTLVQSCENLECLRIDGCHRVTSIEQVREILATQSPIREPGQPPPPPPPATMPSAASLLSPTSFGSSASFAFAPELLSPTSAANTSALFAAAAAAHTSAASDGLPNLSASTGSGGAATASTAASAASAGQGSTTLLTSSLGPFLLRGRAHLERLLLVNTL